MKIYEDITKWYQKYFQTAGKSCKKKRSLHNDCSMRVLWSNELVIVFKAFLFIGKLQTRKSSIFFSSFILNISKDVTLVVLGIFGTISLILRYYRQKSIISTLLIEILCHRCFPVSFANFSKNTFCYRTPLVDDFEIIPKLVNPDWSLIFFKSNFRNNCLQMVFKIDVLNDFSIFTGKHLCWSLFLINSLVCNLIKKRLR